MKPASIILGYFFAMLALIVCFAQQPASIVTSPPASATPVVPVTCPPTGIVLPGVVENIVDGDTVTILLRVHCRVRFLGIDAPEHNTPEGKKAKADLEAHAQLKPCHVFLTLPPTVGGILGDQWSFERWLGCVYLDGEKKSLGAWQIEHGNVKKPPEPVK